MISRTEFYQDKGLLFFLFCIEIISAYLFFVFIKETYIFMIPVAISGFLGLFELWFIQKNERRLKDKNGTTK